MQIPHKKDVWFTVRMVSRNKKIMAGAFFVLLSTAILFANKLSRLYQTEIDVGVRLLGADSGGEQAVSCIVKARGYDILLYKVFPPPCVHISVADPDLPAQEEYYLPVQDFKVFIVQALGDNFELIDIHTDTLKYRMAGAGGVP